MNRYLRLEEETRVVPDHFVYKASFFYKKWQGIPHDSTCNYKCLLIEKHLMTKTPENSLMFLSELVIEQVRYTFGKSRMFVR